MICEPCRTPNGHQRCQSVNCCCRHRGSTVRPLTAHERHLLMVDPAAAPPTTTLPADEPEMTR
jgi:hypothetical protein